LFFLLAFLEMACLLIPFLPFRRKGKSKRKSKYKILDATDQESLELKPNPKAGKT